MTNASASRLDAHSPHAGESIRETIDSIVVALILAFVFRAFVVEAFIIPTGSMAPTLYGAHATILCKSCGTEFAYGLKDPGDPRQVNTQGVRRDHAATCPNCSYRNTPLAVSDESLNPDSGDRILVLKWPIDLGIDALGPQRWDVTVFKDPKDGETNFIKRLAGLPNEVLMIVDGDVYTAPLDRLSPETSAELHATAASKHSLMSRIPPDLRNPGADRKTPSLRIEKRPAPPSPKALSDVMDHLAIAPKTELAQKALWFTVYDHDFPPQVLMPHQPKWIAPQGDISGWEVAERVLRFRDRGAPEDNVVLQGESFRASCAYNILGREEPEVASDLRVRCVVTPITPQGTVGFRLAKWGRVFLGNVDFNGAVSITEEPKAAGVPALRITGQTKPLVPDQPVEVSFENLDYRLSLKVGGREVLASSRDKSAKEYYGPDVKAMSKRQGPATAAPRVFGAGGEFEVTHLAVDRDVHYYHHPDDRENKAVPERGWGSEGHPILLREGEYFMLGDNTSASFDSRLWDVADGRFESRGESFQIGTVPKDQIIGRAFFVYWPAARKIDWLPWNRFGIIPDVGRMRWIR